MDVNFFSAQLKLWTRIFDYKGTSTQKEYWYAFIFHVIIGALAGINIFMSFVALFLMDYRSYDYYVATGAGWAHYIFIGLALIKIAYLIIAIIPWIALTVRRLRDAGKSAWWIILLLLFGIGHIILFLICATASSLIGAFEPDTNYPEAIYGPPEMLDPSLNQNGDVYGPPPFDIEPDENDFDPNENIMEGIYGPPAGDDYDPNVNFQPTLYGPPLDVDPNDYDLPYDPDLNLNEDVYGPPEWFE